MRSMTGRAAEHRAITPLPTGVGRGPGGNRNSSPNRCPVPSCHRPIDPSRLMCRDHWYLVPKPLRDRIWATWRSGEGARERAHRDAVLLAVGAASAPSAAGPGTLRGEQPSAG
jgi:hypothetical protein